MLKKILSCGILITSLFAEDSSNLCANKDCPVIITDFIPFQTPCPPTDSQNSFENIDELIQNIEKAPDSKPMRKRKSSLIQSLLSLKQKGNRVLQNDPIKSCPGKNIQANDPSLQGV